MRVAVVTWGLALGACGPSVRTHSPTPPVVVDPHQPAEPSTSAPAAEERGVSCPSLTSRRKSDTWRGKAQWCATTSGCRKGPYVQYRVDGSLYETGHYSLNRKSGVWWRYRRDGTPLSRATYARGKLDGVVLQYARDGTVVDGVEYEGDEPVVERLDQRRAIRDAFAAFQRARGAFLAARATVTGASVTRLARWHTLALVADADTVRSLEYADLLVVLALRHELGARALADVESDQLLAKMVDTPYVGQRAIDGVVLGRIRFVGDDEARATVVRAGAHHGGEVIFRHEVNRWRLDLASLIPPPPARHLAEFTPVQRALHQITEASGRRVLDSVWQPPARPMVGASQ